MNPSSSTESKDPANHLVAYVVGSSGSDPGHLVIGHESPIEHALYVGYRFDPADLPAEFQDAEKWRDYLFRNSVPGHIVDETAYVRRILTLPSRTVYAKKAVCTANLEVVLPASAHWYGFALYSFNPDNFTNQSVRCYNCVTWGTETANRLVADFLRPVRQGRVKLIIQQLESHAASGNGGEVP